MSKANSATRILDQLGVNAPEIKAPNQKCRNTRRDLEDLIQQAAEIHETCRKQSGFGSEPIFNTPLAKSLLLEKYKSFHSSFMASQSRLDELRAETARLDDCTDPMTFHVECLALGVRYNEWMDYYKTVPLPLMAEMMDIIDVNYDALTAELEKVTAAQQEKK